MKLWRLRVDVKRGDVSLLAPSNYFEDHFVGRPLAAEWKPPDLEILRPRGKLRDFVDWMVAAPVISERAARVLGPLVKSQAELLPLVAIRGMQYYAMNIIRLVDCLDRQHSRIVYSPTRPNKIINIFSWSFDPVRLDPTALIFKLPDRTTDIFVQQRFVDVVIRERLDGVAFEDPALSSVAPLFRK